MYKIKGYKSPLVSLDHWSQICHKNFATKRECEQQAQNYMAYPDKLKLKIGKGWYLLAECFEVLAFGAISQYFVQNDNFQLPYLALQKETKIVIAMLPKDGNLYAHQNQTELSQTLIKLKNKLNDLFAILNTENFQEAQKVKKASTFVL